ncbi:MAG: class 1 fructose-bisphosphatase [Salinivirgaceae bacterium]|jgi:fructose-1,6-bisphosphatase I|nr:class 1 fructose-bisphosphatase [Salinivirgaceae bacterium]
MDNYLGITLNEFIIRRQSDFKYATGELSRLLSHIGVAAKIVNREVNKAGLVDVLGDVGTINTQGEAQQKLDVYADSQFIHALRASGEVCGMASEEVDDIVTFDSILAKDGNYIVCIDPLDGSSNIDVNVSIGTIFSIYRRVSQRGHLAENADFLQEGIKQVAGGYVIYGSSTMLVYTTGKGVNGFTLDPSIGEFCLSHANLVIPENGSLYSINEGYMRKFDESIQRYIKYVQEIDPETKRPYKARYIGSLVADFHRNLLNGGIYLYPATQDQPNGKLRLLYEANPLAFIVEQSGGMAVDGANRILDLKPNTLHQRTPLIIGSTNMVKKVMEFIEND